MDPEIVEMVQLLNPETAEILQFLDPKIVKMDKKFLDPEIVELVWFLDPEIIEKVSKSYIDLRKGSTVVKATGIVKKNQKGWISIINNKSLFQNVSAWSPTSFLDYIPSIWHHHEFLLSDLLGGRSSLKCHLPRVQSPVCPPHSHPVNKCQHLDYPQSAC